jgi:hypothetical protein
MAWAVFCLRKVTLGEHSARSGLQITFESKCGFLGTEFERYDDVPGTIASRMNAATGVVPEQSFGHIGRHANVVSIGVAIASEYVDEPFFGASHNYGICKVFS